MIPPVSSLVVHTSDLKKSKAKWGCKAVEKWECIGWKSGDNNQYKTDLQHTHYTDTKTNNRVGGTLYFKNNAITTNSINNYHEQIDNVLIIYILEISTNHYYNFAEPCRTHQFKNEGTVTFFVHSNLKSWFTSLPPLYHKSSIIFSNIFLKTSNMLAPVWT